MKKRPPDIVKLDRRYVWHPFTQMRDWTRQTPIVLSSGDGAVLRDINGREYLDANSSIWTNLHGHNHPEINLAIETQLRKVSHTSALGFASEPASLLAEKLVMLAGKAPKSSTKKSPTALKPSDLKNPRLTKVFFSDDGSTAMEVALKLAYAFAIRSGAAKKPRFLSLQGAYHGDTVGAVALGHIDLFHKAYSGLLFKSDHVMAPYCYRCPFNRAAPERADARSCRKCNHECLDLVEKKFAAQTKRGAPYAGFIFEPLMQGAAGMIPQPAGWLNRVSQIARAHKTKLIADEVMTGFGRTGTLFACHREGVQPDFLSVAKGLTGGYMPMAATLTTHEVFDAFLGDYTEFKSFFHGHSFTANQLGSAASLASLDILTRDESQLSRAALAQALHEEAKQLWRLPQIGDIRIEGCVAGIELVRDWKTRTAFDLREKAGIRVCEAMARRGVLTRPVGNVIVILPPYCTTPAQVRKIITALSESVEEVFGGTRSHKAARPFGH
jgi:adenosylmethionine-8-amino-7-oxononanoate aminotransferase